MSQTGVGRYQESGLTTPKVDPWLVRRIAAGWRPDAIVAACDGRISRRTAYRWAAEFVRLETVTVGGHSAEFVIRRTLPPARISPWRPAP